jgi:hypothetical protein
MRKRRIDRAGLEVFLSKAGPLDITTDPETSARVCDKALDRALSAACRTAGVALKLS